MGDPYNTTWSLLNGRSATCTDAPRDNNRERYTISLFNTTSQQQISYNRYNGDNVTVSTGSYRSFSPDLMTGVTTVYYTDGDSLGCSGSGLPGILLQRNMTARVSCSSNSEMLRCSQVGGCEYELQWATPYACTGGRCGQCLKLWS